MVKLKFVVREVIVRFYEYFLYKNKIICLKYMIAEADSHMFSDLLSFFQKI